MKPIGVCKSEPRAAAGKGRARRRGQVQVDGALILLGSGIFQMLCMREGRGKPSASSRVSFGSEHDHVAGKRCNVEALQPPSTARKVKADRHWAAAVAGKGFEVGTERAAWSGRRDARTYSRWAWQTAGVHHLRAVLATLSAKSGCAEAGRI